MLPSLLMSPPFPAKLPEQLADKNFPPRPFYETNLEILSPIVEEYSSTNRYHIPLTISFI